MKYIIPQQTILLFILLVGCEGVYTPKDDVHLIIGEWTGLEREQKLINSDGITLSTDINTYNKVWTFDLDSTFSVMDVNSFDDNLFINGKGGQITIKQVSLGVISNLILFKYDFIKGVEAFNFQFATIIL